MRAHALLLACMSCHGHGRRIQGKHAQIEGKLHDEINVLQAVHSQAVGYARDCNFDESKFKAISRINRMKMVAGLILSQSPELAWHGQGLSVGRLALARSRVQSKWKIEAVSSPAAPIINTSTHASHDFTAHAACGSYFSTRAVCGSHFSSSVTHGTNFKHKFDHCFDSGILSSELFCNREIDLKQVDAVGFDMDFTLASYTTKFDLLAFDGAKHKLVKDHGYPSDVLNFKYDPKAFPRGLVIDVERGNIIKADRHKYVRVACHGRRVLSSAERKEAYRPSFEGVPGFSGSNWVKLDTLFQAVDAELFSQLVDLKDRKPQQLQQSYKEIYSDVRSAVDMCHRDGTIKREVAQNPYPYIQRDGRTLPLLKEMKRAGKKVFLLTNSDWHYTNVIMNHLWGNQPDGRDHEWMSLFDVIICSANKPGFLTDNCTKLFRVQTHNGLPEKTVGVSTDTASFLAQGKVFQGGNYRHLHKMLNLFSGERVLYVGDHMYSDVLRTKRTLGWRTCLIIPELEQELTLLADSQDLRCEMFRLRKKQLLLDEDLDQAVLEEGPRSKVVLRMQHLQSDVKAMLKEVTRTYHKSFHDVWGQLFKAGYQDSLFAKQVAGYACLYTSKVGNLYMVSPMRHFRPTCDEMPHERP